MQTLQSYSLQNTYETIFPSASVFHDSSRQWPLPLTYASWFALTKARGSSLKAQRLAHFSV